MLLTGTTALSICKRALADIGTRSTITSVFPTDGSTESSICSLYYNGVLLQLLRAANWNFATRTNLLSLWKALPGTPENPSPATLSGWSPAYPAPPWVYSYVYPIDCIRARKLIGQPQQVPIAPPIFSGSQGTNPPISQRLPLARFEVSTDVYDASGQPILGLGSYPPTISNSGTGYNAGDVVTLAGGTLTSGAAYAPFTGRPAGVQIVSTSTGGAVTEVQIVDPGTYAVTTPTLTQATNTGTGTGLVLTIPPTHPSATSTWSAVGQMVISTQQEFAMLEYTYWDSTTEVTMDSTFEEALVAALAGRLSQPLTGDKALARDKFGIANSLIINARALDANEGLTINDHIPDWIRTRGVGGGLGYEMFFYPLGPLFPVAPLV